MNPEVVFFPSLFGMIAFVVWVIANGWQRRHHLRLMTDFNSRLLDRIGSVKDFSEFLQTEGGAKFMDSLALGPTPRDVKFTILRAVQTGIVLFALGVGLLFLAWHFAAGLPDEARVFTTLGVITLSLGAGFLLSGGASYRLATGMRRTDG
jgi:hypothetical protein